MWKDERASFNQLPPSSSLFYSIPSYSLILALISYYRRSYSYRYVVSDWVAAAIGFVALFLVSSLPNIEGTVESIKGKTVLDDVHAHLCVLFCSCHTHRPVISLSLFLSLSNPRAIANDQSSRDGVHSTRLGGVGSLLSHSLPHPRRVR